MDRKLDLTPDTLLEDAREAAGGLDDFGDPSFRSGLDVLVETYESAGLNPGGRKRTRSRLVQLLSNRLMTEQAWKDHPEIREVPIEKPVYLTGFPRTGTSALFNLLGKDDDARPLLLWEAMFPTPLGKELGPGEEDPRLVGMRAYYEYKRKSGKESAFDKIHFADAEVPEECVLLQAHTFCDVQNGIEPLMSPYREYFEGSDLHAPYAYYADMLRMLQFQRPGERWLLKSPAHLWAIDVLVEMFPDVCIIMTHRDPMQILPSYCSMMEAVMSVREKVDKHEIGRSVLSHLGNLMDRGLAARDTVGADRFIDVDYREFVSDPLTSARRIYDYFEIEMTAQAEAAMKAHVDANPSGKHGKHEYDLSEYGLSAGQVRERIGGYLERFDVPFSG